MPQPPANGLHGADRLAKAGHLTRAIEAYSNLIDAQAHEEAALIRRGRLYREMFRYTQAEADFRRALAINPGSDEALKHLGWILRDTERIEEALSVFSRLLAIGGPGNSTVARTDLGQLLRYVWRYAAAAKIMAPLAACADKNLVGRYAKAKDDAASERTHALAYIRRLRAGPVADEDLLTGAEHLLKSGWPRLALRLLQKIRDQAAHAQRSLTVHFFAAWQVHSATAALEALNGYAAIIPANNRHFAYARALALHQQGRHEDAIATLLLVQEQDRDDSLVDLLLRIWIVSERSADNLLASFGSLVGAAPSVSSARCTLSALVLAGKIRVSFDAGEEIAGGFPGPIRPRTLLQFWDSDPPAEIQSLTGEWAARNKGWSHLLFSEEHARIFIRSHFGIDVAALFDTCHHAAMKSDFFRLCYLYVSGGVYIDADENCLMAADAFFFGWQDAPFAASISLDLPFYVHNWFLCSVPGHPIVRIAIDLMLNALNTARDSGIKPNIWQTTGPGCITRAIATHCMRVHTSGRMPEDIVLISHNRFRRFAKMPDLAYKKEQAGNWRLA